MINPRKISMAGTRAGDTISDGIESSAHSLICVPYIGPLPSNVPFVRLPPVLGCEEPPCQILLPGVLDTLALSCSLRRPFLSTRSGNKRMGRSGQHTLMGRSDKIGLLASIVSGAEIDRDTNVFPFNRGDQCFRRCLHCPEPVDPEFPVNGANFLPGLCGSQFCRLALH